MYKDSHMLFIVIPSFAVCKPAMVTTYKL